MSLNGLIFPVKYSVPVVVTFFVWMTYCLFYSGVLLQFHVIFRANS